MQTTNINISCIKTKLAHVTCMAYASGTCLLRLTTETVLKRYSCRGNGFIDPSVV
jgi:hypothetical protein